MFIMVVGLIIGILYLFWDVFYWAKWVASYLALLLKKVYQRRRFDLYDRDADNQPEKLGILVPKEEKVLESPFSEEHLQNAKDEISLYGVNSKSEMLLVTISRACNDHADAWLYLKLSNGLCYELEQTGDFQRNFGDKCTSFTCGGLQMHYLTPMRRWRIVYCGMLRERNTNEDAKAKTVFVKFTFLWTASSEVYDASCDLHVRQTADAIAKAQWKSLFPPVQKVAKTLNFYCQSGVVSGIVSIENEPNIEMYLFGEKIRNIGKNSYLDRCKFKHILGAVPESGLTLHLIEASVPNVLHNLYFGFAVRPNGLLYVIEDGIIISNFCRNDAESKQLTVMFKAGEQYELRGTAIDNDLKFMNAKGWNGHFELNPIEFEIDGCRGSGFVIASEGSAIPQAKIPRNLSLLVSKRPLTVYFTDEIGEMTDITGGKGSSLCKLTKLSKQLKLQAFIVPKGIVVTTVAYEQFLTRGIIEKIENLKNIVYGNVKGNVHEASKIVTSAIERACLPDKITKEIEENLNKLFNGRVDQYKFAVRSSATGEDTDQMSAAGQMDTFLGIEGLKEIFTALKKCWASQFGYIAVEYKRQNGQILNSPMAVVIQEMVECEAAGVIFTCDPVTNNPSVVVISANYGLGESVVSGSEEPDTIVLQKFSKNEVKVTAMNVGLKQHKIVMTDTKQSEDQEGIITEDVPEEKKNECCISEEMAVSLGKLSLKIENYFKSPRDIEFGIKNNIIYMLQSRPITTGNAITDYEIKHEFDGPLRCEHEYYTICNVGEVMPGATSPLGLEIINKYFAMVFRKDPMRQRQRKSFMESRYFNSCLLPYYNHVMMSVADLLTRTGDFDSVTSQSWMLGIFGRVIDDPDLVTLLQRRKYDPVRKGVVFYLRLLKDMFYSGYGIEELKERIFKYEIPAEQGKKPKEIFDLLAHSCDHLVEPFFTHVNCTEMSTIWNTQMFTILEKAKGSVDNEVYSDFAKLLASTSNVESADVPSAMQNLAHSIVKDIKSETFRKMTVEKAQQWLETSDNGAGYQYRQFMTRHGHRCLKEVDMHSLPWSLDPKPLIELLQNMSGSCDNVKEKEEESLSDILPRLTVPLNWKTRLLLKFVLPNCRRGVRERETCKSIYIKSMDNIRKGFRHLSKSMVAEGYLPDAELIFFMTIDEINDLLESRNPKLISRANHRRRLFPVMDDYIFPEISKGSPVPINEKTNEEEFQFVSDLTMKGIPVSQGTVKGYARVAMSLEEASHLKKGEILITHSTDIGWSPYFPILAGVVTELGGLISHGAVVSREYGLPCVVGLHGATRQFVTGDYVLLDGNKGILQRLSPPEN